MRRRIKIMPDGGLEDITTQPQCYNVEDSLPYATLYDDPIWYAYVAARSAFRQLEQAVIGHFHGGEAYDAVERQAALEATALIDDREMRLEVKTHKMEEIAARVATHATDLYGNGEAPR